MPLMAESPGRAFAGTPGTGCRPRGVGPGRLDLPSERCMSCSPSSDIRAGAPGGEWRAGSCPALPVLRVANHAACRALVTNAPVSPSSVAPGGLAEWRSAPGVDDPKVRRRGPWARRPEMQGLVGCFAEPLLPLAVGPSSPWSGAPAPPASDSLEPLEHRTCPECVTPGSRCAPAARSDPHCLRRTANGRAAPAMRWVRRSRFLILRPGAPDAVLKTGCRVGWPSGRLRLERIERLHQA